MQLIAIFTITLILVQCSSSLPPPPPPPPAVDHIQFVQTWTPTICKPVGRIECPSPLPQYYSNNFSMHGLWPAKSDGDTLRLPKNKTTPLISEEVFKKLEAKLDIWWAVIDETWDPKSEFWQNEWLKHGQLGLWGEGDDAAEAYFIDGIKARQGINLLQILQRGGLRFNTYYTKQDIVGAMRAPLGVQNVYLSCQKDQLLYEVLICMDKKTHRFITCPLDNRPRGCFGTHLRIPV